MLRHLVLFENPGFYLIYLSVFTSLSKEKAIIFYLE